MTRLSREQWVAALQRNIAVRSVGSSAMRKAPAGTVMAAHQYLGNIDLSTMPSDEVKFVGWLEHHTDILLNAMPKRASWGRSRKALNLFLRDCSYNHELRSVFGFDKRMKLLDLPLDKFAAIGIKKNCTTAPDRWLGVSSLDADQSRAWQVAAGNIARDTDVSRVDLDVLFYRVAKAEARLV